MGIIRLTLFSAIGIGGAMLWFGRDEGLPENRLGRERVESPVIVVAAPVAAPVEEIRPTPAPAPQPASEPAPPEPEPEAEPEAGPAPEPEPEPQAQPEPEPEAEPEQPAVLPVLYVTGTRVNMRAGPSTRNGIVASLVRGTAVDDMGEAGPGWSQIRVIETGQRGFMATRFLSPDQP